MEHVIAPLVLEPIDPFKKVLVAETPKIEKPIAEIPKIADSKNLDLIPDIHARQNRSPTNMIPISSLANSQGLGSLSGQHQLAQQAAGRDLSRYANPQQQNPQISFEDFAAARNWYPINKTWPKWIIVNNKENNGRVLVKSLDEEIQAIIYNAYGKDKLEQGNFIQLYSQVIHRSRGY